MNNLFLPMWFQARSAGVVWLVWCLALSLGVTGARAERARTTLVLPMIAKGSDVKLTQMALQRAYHELGFQVQFVEIPSERALAESNAGRMDGEMVRIEEVASKYPNLRRVNVLMFYNVYSVYVRKADGPAPANMNELARYSSVGIISGRKFSEKLTEGWVGVTRINNYAAAVKMLGARRIDALFGREEEIRATMEEQGINVGQFDRRILFQVPLYHYLHLKHEALIPRISTELNRIKGKYPTVNESIKAMGEHR